MATFTGTNSGEVLPLVPALALGDDTIYGRGGNDILAGYTGSDILEGGTGADVVIGGTLNVKLGLGTTKAAGSDTASYASSKAGVTVDLSEVENLSTDLLGIKIDAMEGVRGAGGDAQGDMLFGITNLRGSAAADRLTGDDRANGLAGNSGNDALAGGAGNDRLTGGLGNDSMNGGSGADRMEGGGGNDTYTVDNIRDKVIEDLDDCVDTVRSSINYILPQYVNNLTLLSSGKISGKGNSLENELTGNAASNILTGGRGDDTFIFRNELGPKNVDTITDFSNASGNNDHFELDNAVFKGLAAGKLASSGFYAGAEAHDKSDRILYDKAHGDLYFDRDGSRDTYDRVKFANVDDNTALSYSDFLIV